MLEIIPAYDRIDEIRELFREYTALLVSLDPDFAHYLEIQNYDEEQRDPGEKYREPEGRLYIAVYEGRTAGCIAMKALDKNRAEMKRLYVRPDYRGKGIASALVKRILEDASELGYTSIYLDTLSSLTDAVRLYQKMGFERIESYNESPCKSTLFFRKKLC